MLIATDNKMVIEINQNLENLFTFCKKTSDPNQVVMFLKNNQDILELINGKYISHKDNYILLKISELISIQGDLSNLLLGSEYDSESFLTGNNMQHIDSTG